MGDALMTVDTGFFLAEAALMVVKGSPSLFGKIHRFKLMTVATLPGVGLLHGVPNILRQLHTLGFKFFLGIDGTDNGVKNLIAGLDLADDFMMPLLGYMAVGTGGSDPGGIVKMNRLLQLLIHSVFHLMAGDAKRLGIGQLQDPVKTTPKENAENEKGGHRRKGDFGGLTGTVIASAHVSPSSS